MSFSVDVTSTDKPHSSCLDYAQDKAESPVWLDERIKKEQVKSEVLAVCHRPSWLRDAFWENTSANVQEATTGLGSPKVKPMRTWLHT